MRVSSKRTSSRAAHAAPQRVFDVRHGSRRKALDGGFVLKRCLDSVLALCFLILGLPVLVVAAIAIKLDSRGPIFYSQPRMGRGFKSFKIWKLRTMGAGCVGPVYTSSEDPRVTRIGRWLRWSKVDELPQLWNVLRGDMSLVGPRPVVPELIIGFEQSYRRLLEVRPGLTDPATLKYCREDEFLSMVSDKFLYYQTILIPDKLRLSAEYIEHASTGSDVVLLFKTLFALAHAGFVPQLIRERLAANRTISKWFLRDPAQGVEVQAAGEKV